MDKHNAKWTKCVIYTDVTFEKGSLFIFIIQAPPSQSSRKAE